MLDTLMNFACTVLTIMIFLASAVFLGFWIVMVIKDALSGR